MDRLAVGAVAAGLPGEHRDGPSVLVAQRCPHRPARRFYGGEAGAATRHRQRSLPLCGGRKSAAHTCCRAAAGPAGDPGAMPTALYQFLMLFLHFHHLQIYSHPREESVILCLVLLGNCIRHAPSRWLEQTHSMIVGGVGVRLARIACLLQAAVLLTWLLADTNPLLLGRPLLDLGVILLLDVGALKPLVTGKLAPRLGATVTDTAIPFGKKVEVAYVSSLESMLAVGVLPVILTRNDAVAVELFESGRIALLVFINSFVLSLLELLRHAVQDTAADDCVPGDGPACPVAVKASGAPHDSRRGQLDGNGGTIAAATSRSIGSGQAASSASSSPAFSRIQPSVDGRPARLTLARYLRHADRIHMAIVAVQSVVRARHMSAALRSCACRLTFVRMSPYVRAHAALRSCACRLTIVRMSPHVRSRAASRSCVRHLASTSPSGARPLVD